MLNAIKPSGILLIVLTAFSLYNAMAKDMFRVVVIDGVWKYISDGKITIYANRDLRSAGQPPKITLSLYGQAYVGDYETIDRNTKVDAVNTKYGKISISPYSIDMLLRNGGIKKSEIRYQRSLSDILEKGWKYTIVLGFIGYIIGNLIQKKHTDFDFNGLIIGMICGVPFAFKSEFKHQKLYQIFKTSSAVITDWANFEKELNQRIEIAKKDYLDSSKKLWSQYHKIKNILENTAVSDLDKLSGIDFEKYIQQLYVKRGYVVELTKTSNDYGVDLIAKNKSEVIAIQAKRYSKLVGISAVQEVSAGAKYYKASKAVVITNSTFTKNAIELSKKVGVELVDKAKLSQMICSLNLVNNKEMEFDENEFEKMQYEMRRYLRQNKI